MLQVSEKPQSAWADFYAGRDGDDYLRYVEERYAPFISAIVHRWKANDLVLEIGAGTGTISKALSLFPHPFGLSLNATDVDPEMVKLTKKRLWFDNVATYQLNAITERLVPQAQVVHSHGMLEHFDDATIRQVIHNFRNARVQVHYVPGLYDAPSFGDERLMSTEQWEDICAPDQIITFNGGLDYALVFER